MNRLAALSLPLLAACLLALPAPAQAAQGDMDIQLLRPTFAPWGLMSTPGARPGRQWTVRAGLMLQYERAPLVVIDQTDEIAKVVSDRVGFNVGGYVALLDGFGVGLSIPMYAQGGDYYNYSVPGFALGDMRIDVAYRLLDLGFFALAVRGDFFLPTSTKDAFAGERKPRAMPALTAEFGVPRFSGVFEFSGMIRERVHTGFDMDMGVELGILVGLKGWAIREKLLIMGEFQSRASVQHFLTGAIPQRASSDPQTREHWFCLQNDIAKAENGDS